MLTPLGEAIQSLKRKAQDSEDPAQTYKLLKQRADAEAMKKARYKREMEDAQRREVAFRQAAKEELMKQSKETIADMYLDYVGGGAMGQGTGDGASDDWDGEENGGRAGEEGDEGL